MPLPDVVRALFTRQDTDPDGTYLRFGSRVISWSEMADATCRAANGFLALGVSPGDRVALMMRNSPEFLISYLGMIAVGAGPVPLNVKQRGNALAYILSDSNPVVAVVDDDLLPVFDSVAPTPITRVVVGTPSFAELMANASPRLTDTAEPQLSGLGILYTSGTTGPPKGVVATGYDLNHVHSLLQRVGAAPGETVYTALPLFHGNALILSAMAAIWNGWTLALAERFSASGFWDDIRQSNAVSFNALGSMIPILLKQPASANDRDNPVRTVLSAACPPWAWQEFEQRFVVRLVEFYGLVDYPGYLVNDEDEPGLMGRPIADTKFRVVDDADADAPVGAIGELVMQHPLGRLTYYQNNPDATDEAYRNGWFHTGDLASIDDAGRFRYMGRKKASMRRRGENVSAWEVENVLNLHPAVAESAAHAVPSDLGEDEIKAVVVFRPGLVVAPQELIDFCQGRLADYAIPEYVEVVDELPKTETHRVEYERLRERGITFNVAPIECREVWLMRDVHVVGVGMTRFEKSQRGLKELAAEAVTQAMSDAGASIEDISSAYVGNAAAGLITGQEMIRGQVMLRGLGIESIPIFNIENACASASSALHLGWRAIATEVADIVLCVGAEKLTHPDKSVTLAAIGTAIDVEARAELSAGMGDAPDSSKRSFFMDLYAEMTADYMSRTGATVEHFAQVAVKAHHNGSLNPRAQYGSELTIEDVLASREVVAPLTLMMCSPVSDGAAAVILASKRGAERLGRQGPRIRASIVVSGNHPDPSDPTSGSSGRAAKQAYEMSGFGPDDLSCVEVHDASAPAELMVYEQIGLASPGGGPDLISSGATSLGGRLPVNTSGGLLAKGHPIGATGIAQICEASWQLRGEAGPRQVAGARVAMTQNGGGWLEGDSAAMAVHILTAD